VAEAEPQRAAPPWPAPGVDEPPWPAPGVDEPPWPAPGVDEAPAREPTGSVPVASRLTIILSGYEGEPLMRVLAAMSGGVDSAVAAALAVDAGHEVTGVHMALSRNPGTLRTGSRGCCTVEDAFDARRVCDLLGIPYYVWDFSEDFLDDVVADFLSEYSAGRTPNPCLRCNEKIKFAALLDRAIALGFDAVATGHHVRMYDGILHRAVDAAKDQSYVLAVLTADQLAHSMFPLGDLTKQQVRAEAARRGFAVAAKPDSYDICFIPDGDTRGYLTDKLGARTGSVVDAESGEVLAQHDGFFGYTIGQRKGLNLQRPAPDGRPRYVLGIEPVTGTVTVGPASGLDVGVITAERVVFSRGEPPRFPLRAVAQLRAHGGTVRGSADLVDGRLRVVLDEPVRGVAPGQTVVLYDDSDEFVIGAGTIVRAA
jgi:tRNA-specific 2-thiouridylase